MHTFSVANHLSHFSIPNRNALAKRYMGSEYQIDFFSSGTGGSSICLRYGVPGDYRIMVYDGGSIETGETVVKHIRKRYDTNVIHDLISSHPHADHALGLWPILENLEIQHFWMHRPWAHSPAIARFFQTMHRSSSPMAAHFEDKIAITRMLEEKAFKRGIRISEPFQGMQIGPMTVLSPHRDWYVHRLLTDFEDPPPAKRRISPDLLRLLKLESILSGEPEETALSESGNVETLTESGQVSAEMESSVVLHGLIGGQGVLLTGNAGIKALSNAAAYAEQQRIFVQTHLRHLQVPHHGDCNHVSPSVLDRLIGPKLATPLGSTRVTAFVSTPYGRSEYPHRSVVNALSRRGVAVMHAEGKMSNTWHSGLTKDAMSIGIIPLSTENCERDH